MGSLGFKGISARFLEGINSGLSSLNQNQTRWVGSLSWWVLIKKKLRWSLYAVVEGEPSKRPGFLGGHDGILWGIVLLSQIMLEFVEEMKLQTQYKMDKISWTISQMLSIAVPTKLEWFFKGFHHLELLLRYCCSSFDGAAKASLYTNGAVWKPNGVQQLKSTFILTQQIT